jgi:predicted nucleic acid-binding protein
MNLQAWESATRLLKNAAIEPAPFTCRDLDDQVFINMAYSLRPALLLSKDLLVLELRTSAKPHGVEISNQYDRLHTLLS